MARGGKVGSLSSQGPGRRHSLECIRMGKLPEGLFQPSCHPHHRAYSMGGMEYSHTPRCYAPQPPVNPRHWTTDHPGSDTDLAVNHRPYPSVADRHTWESVPIPTFFVAITHSLIKHQPLFPRIVITHADSFLPNPAVANFVCTLDLLLLHAHLPQCLVL